MKIIISESQFKTLISNLDEKDIIKESEKPGSLKLLKVI